MPPAKTSLRCASPKFYSCSLCSARIPSLQALGGHKSVHSGKRRYGGRVPVVPAQEGNKRQRHTNLEHRSSTSSESDAQLAATWEQMVLPYLSRSSLPANLSPTFPAAVDLQPHDRSGHHTSALLQHEGLNTVAALRCLGLTRSFTAQQPLLRTISPFSAAGSYPRNHVPASLDDFDSLRNIPLSPNSQGSSTPSLLVPSASPSGEDSLKSGMSSPAEEIWGTNGGTRLCKKLHCDPATGTPGTKKDLGCKGESGSIDLTLRLGL